MKRKTKTTIVTIEARERMTIRREMPSMLAWCDRCAEEVWMVTASEAALISMTDLRTIFRGVESGTVHFIEDERSTLLLCSKSLSPTNQGFQ
jgi:hypothetical protein